MGGVNGVDGEVNGVDGEVDGDLGEVDGVDGEVDGVHGEGNAVHGEVNGVQGEVSGVEEVVDAVHGEVDGVDGDVDGLDEAMFGSRGPAGQGNAVCVLRRRRGVSSLRPEKYLGRGALTPATVSLRDALCLLSQHPPVTRAGAQPALQPRERRGLCLA